MNCRFTAYLVVQVLALGCPPVFGDGEIVAFNGFTDQASFGAVMTQQNNIWNGIDGVILGQTGQAVTGPDVIDAVNGFTAQANDFSNLPLGGDPLAGTSFIDFGAWGGNATNGRGTVYVFDVAPGDYTLQFAASWNSIVSSAVVDAYLYDVTLTPTIDHRFDWNTGAGNAFLYGGLSGINPTNAESLDGVELLFDNGVLSGAQALASTSAPFTVGPDDLVVFRLAGIGLGDDSSQARLDLLQLIPLSPTLIGDYNDDDVVDAGDYTVWRDTLGSQVDLRANGDDTGASASVIDLADYAAWKSNFGQPTSALASASVPEPKSLLLGWLCCLGSLGIRRRQFFCRQESVI